MSFHLMYKFVIIGDSGVGKSSINLQFTEKQTILNHNITLGVEFGVKTIKLQGKNIKLQIWDTAGQQNFKSIARSYYKSAIGALLVYDITRRETFNGVKEWYEELKENGNQHMEVLLVGNKSDLESQRVISYEEGARFAKMKGLNFVEISARNYGKVSDAFQSVAANIYKKMEEGKIPVQNIGIKLGDSPQKQPSLITPATDNKSRGRCC